MLVANKKVTQSLRFGVVVSSRQFFSAGDVAYVRDSICTQLMQRGIGIVIGSNTLTQNGAVASFADAKRYAELFQRSDQAIDGIIVALANFGDEIGVVETIRLANLGVPILVQACPDTLTRLGVKERKDSWCGKISVCNNLHQYGIPWTDTKSHVVDPSSDEFGSDIDFFVGVCNVVRGLKGARIGAIGTRPAAFQTVRYSEKIMQKMGITVVPVDLAEIMSNADKIDDYNSLLLEKVDEIQSYGSIPISVPRQKVLLQAKLSLSIEQWLLENECDASAVQCWNTLESSYGCAACLTMSMAGESLHPSACEVDVTGAISMYTLTLASRKPAALLDWNNNYGDMPNLVVGTHCSNFPKSFVANPIEISSLDLLGETFGQDRCFGAVKGHVGPGDFTFFRASTDDSQGTIKAYCGEGEFTSDSFEMDGGIAVCRIQDLRGLTRHITREGFEHHVAMVRGNVANIVDEAVTRYLGWSLYHHAGRGNMPI